MSQQGAHSYEDKLLEFAYGELPSAEARSVEAHVKGCARCAGALDSIRGVRRTMSALEAEPAPDAGLESLLAYAGQAARRIQAGPAPSHARFRRWVFSLAGVASLAVLGIVASQVAREVNPLAQKEKALAEQRREESAAAATAAAPEPAAPASAPAEEAQAAHANGVDKLGDMANAVEGGRSTFPSAGPQVERRGAELDDGRLKNKAPGTGYLPQAQLGSKGALDRRDYSQRNMKPLAVRSKKAAAKADLDSSGWEPLQYKEGGGGSPGGSMDLPAKELDGKQKAAPAGDLAKKQEEAPRRVTLPLQTQSKDAYTQPAPPADEAFSDDLEAPLGGVEAEAPAEPAPAKSAPEVSRSAERELTSQPTSSSANTRQRASTGQTSTPSTPIARSPAPPPSTEQKRDEDGRSIDRTLSSRQEKLRAQIEVTTERSKLIGLYSELCDVELQLGLYQPESCQHIVQKFSGTNAAYLAKNRLESQRQAYEQRMLDEERVKKASKVAPARQ